MNCGEEIKQRCDTVYSACVKYELEIPEFSSLKGGNCLSIEDTTKDLYQELSKVLDGINLDELGASCLTYIIPNEVPKVKDILLKYEVEICELKNKVKALEETAICDINITECGLDLEGVADQCENPITKLGELLEYLLMKAKTT